MQKELIVNEKTTAAKAKPTALCLGGGGVKAAYQLGVWKALDEAHLLTDVRAAAGCAAGALNAVLFALGEWELARQTWEAIQPDDLLAPAADGAYFTREGLSRLLETLPLETLKERAVRVYAGVQNAETGEPVFFELNDLPAEEIRTLLLASSAMPQIYPPEEYQGVKYLCCNAMPKGNLCIAPLYAQGHKQILAVSLQPQTYVTGGKTSVADELIQDYPDADFTLIQPIKAMSNLLSSTLSFVQERIRSHMEQGYQEGSAAVNEFRETPQTHDEMNAKLVEKMTKLFPNGYTLADFIQGFHSRFAPNVQFPTLGGKVWYDNIFEVDGWRLQQQRTIGLKSHYRILNPKNVRAAWVLSPQTLLDALCDYEASLNTQQKS